MKLVSAYGVDIFQMDNQEKKSHGRSMAGMQGVRSYEEERAMLGVTHSAMTKSLSTPSIPAATRAAAAGKKQ